MTAPQDIALEWARQFAALLESMTGEAASASTGATLPEGELLWWEQRLASGARQFAALLESMTGEAASASTGASPPEGELLWWEQRLASGARSARFQIGIEEEACSRLGQELLHAAGIEDGSAADARRTCFDAAAEAASGMARVLSERFGIAICCEGGSRCDRPAERHLLAGVHVQWHGREFHCAVTRKAAELWSASEAPVRDVAAVVSAPNTATLDVLMDLELPVSISFGRAELPLKEVLKLGGGSIVELNRGASEPVDIVVNKSVIARGEVVVVEGNYGVRILEIASRQERLKDVS